MISVLNWHFYLDFWGFFGEGGDTLNHKQAWNLFQIFRGNFDVTRRISYPPVKPLNSLLEMFKNSISLVPPQLQQYWIEAYVLQEGFLKFWRGKHYGVFQRRVRGGGWFSTFIWTSKHRKLQIFHGNILMPMEDSFHAAPWIHYWSVITPPLPPPTELRVPSEFMLL